MSATPAITIRPATADDCPLILKFTQDLALYEKALDKVEATTDAFRTTLFGPTPFAHVIFACLDNKPVGMALYFFNYSTWKAKPGLYLEDLIVDDSARAQGVGTALIRELARMAVREGCGRMEWSALDWNKPAIDFYLHKVKAVALDEWTGFRLEGASLTEFASQD
ncbi:hypothetical protein HDU87_008728 [Geranomyces variabilis]|uniref:N-acetyltransferase domain-containing protein n=1 Tax=Geranomyces variabilis TaxID=109894 RepID=A0AAD5XMI5_9FUNG|nr:hypothetical protein HDU87_008728 [Geranomyces variabilis]